MNTLSIGISLTKDEYKKKLAEKKLQSIKSKGQLRNGDIAEKFIAEQKLFKINSPQKYIELKTKYKIDNLLLYYRLKFGGRGVTELIKRFAKASELKGFISELRIETKKIVKEKKFSKKKVPSKKYYESLGIFCTSKEYRIVKAKEVLSKTPEPEVINFTEDKDAIIAELKVLKATYPEEYKKAKTQIYHTLYRYRKLHGHSGITKIMQKFVQSLPFIKAHMELRDITAQSNKQVSEIVKGTVKIIE